MMNRIELVGETMRRVLDDIARIAPEWLKPFIQPDWGKRYGRKVDLHRMQKREAKRLELAQTIGQDGYDLLTIIYQGDHTPSEVQQLPSVEVLRQVWAQQYYLVDDEIHWRTEKQYGLPPARKTISSPDDLEARYASKDGKTWGGYKVHITETCAEDAPHLITHIATTVATTTDGSVTDKIQDDLIERDLRPDSHWVDGGYTDVDVRCNSQAKKIDLIGPMRPDTSWQARLEHGYDQTRFTIDWDQMVATCPEGAASRYWKNAKTAFGKPLIHFIFSLPVCKACAARTHCTRSKTRGRQLSVPPQEAYEALQRARQRQETKEFKELYRRRAGIEGTIGQAANAKGARRTRYRGLVRTHLQHLMTGAAINLERAVRWLLGERPETTRTSPFAALVAPI